MPPHLIGFGIGQVTYCLCSPQVRSFRKTALEAKRAWYGVKLGHYHPGDGGEGGWFTGLGDAHVGADAQKDEGVFEAQAPLASEEVGGLAAGLAHGVRVVRGGAVGIANALAAQLAISRILYSVSRDGMLPASEFLSRVHPTYRTPSTPPSSSAS